MAAENVTVAERWIAAYYDRNLEDLRAVADPDIELRPAIGESSLLGEAPPNDPEARLAIVVEAIARQAVGIDALVWMIDIAGLSREQAVELMRWSAGALLRAALSDPGSAG